MVSSPKNVLAFADCGKYLFAARTRAGLTQQELAVRTGIATATINRIEREHRWPTLAQVARLAEVLQLPIQWFINGSTQPGNQLPDLAVELHHLGIVDLWVPKGRVPGSFRPPEELVALTISGKEPEPRLVEAIPAILAWNHWNVRLLHAYGSTHGKQTVYRIAWLADVTVTIDKHFGFPGGCPGGPALARFLDRVKKPTVPKVRKNQQALDGLGRPTSEEHLHPVWKRWRISYAATLDTFKSRAEHLQTLLCNSQHPK